MNTVDAGTAGTPAPTAGGAASINIGTSDIIAGPDLVSLGINIGAVAASAQQAASDTGAGAQTGDYVLATSRHGRRNGASSGR